MKDYLISELRRIIGDTESEIHEMLSKVYNKFGKGNEEDQSLIDSVEKEENNISIDLINEESMKNNEIDILNVNDKEKEVQEKENDLNENKENENIDFNTKNQGNKIRQSKLLENNKSENNLIDLTEKQHKNINTECKDLKDQPKFTNLFNETINLNKIINERISKVKKNTNESNKENISKSEIINEDKKIDLISKNKKDTKTNNSKRNFNSKYKFSDSSSDNSFKGIVRRKTAVKLMKKQPIKKKVVKKKENPKTKGKNVKKAKTTNKRVLREKLIPVEKKKSEKSSEIKEFKKSKTKYSNIDASEIGDKRLLSFSLCSDSAVKNKINLGINTRKTSKKFTKKNLSIKEEIFDKNTKLRSLKHEKESTEDIIEEKLSRNNSKIAGKKSEEKQRIPLQEKEKIDYISELEVKPTKTNSKFIKEILKTQKDDEQKVSSFIMTSRRKSAINALKSLINIKEIEKEEKIRSKMQRKRKTVTFPKNKRIKKPGLNEHNDKSKVLRAAKKVNLKNLHVESKKIDVKDSKISFQKERSIIKDKKNNFLGKEVNTLHDLTQNLSKINDNQTKLERKRNSKVIKNQNISKMLISENDKRKKENLYTNETTYLQNKGKKKSLTTPKKRSEKLSKNEEMVFNRKRKRLDNDLVFQPIIFKRNNSVRRSNKDEIPLYKNTDQNLVTRLNAIKKSEKAHKNMYNPNDYDFNDNSLDIKNNHDGITYVLGSIHNDSIFMESKIKIEDQKVRHKKSFLGKNENLIHERYSKKDLNENINNFRKINYPNQYDKNDIFKKMNTENKKDANLALQKDKKQIQDDNSFLKNKHKVVNQRYKCKIATGNENIDENVFKTNKRDGFEVRKDRNTDYLKNHDDLFKEKTKNIHEYNVKYDPETFKTPKKLTYTDKYSRRIPKVSENVRKIYIPEEETIQQKITQNSKKTEQIKKEIQESKRFFEKKKRKEESASKNMNIDKKSPNESHGTNSSNTKSAEKSIEDYKKEFELLIPKPTMASIFDRSENDFLFPRNPKFLDKSPVNKYKKKLFFEIGDKQQPNKVMPKTNLDVVKNQPQLHKINIEQVNLRDQKINTNKEQQILTKDENPYPKFDLRKKVLQKDLGLEKVYRNIANYIPNQQVPKVTSDIVPQSFKTAKWAEDPRLKSTTREYNQDRLDSIFGTVHELDIRKMFPDRRTFRNDSPNKWVD